MKKYEKKHNFISYSNQEEHKMQANTLSFLIYFGNFGSVFKLTRW